MRMAGIKSELLMAKSATVSRKSLVPDPVPLAMQAGDEVILLLPVTVRQRMRDGAVHVIGSGVSRWCEPHELRRRHELQR